MSPYGVITLTLTSIEDSCSIFHSCASKFAGIWTTACKEMGLDLEPIAGVRWTGNHHGTINDLAHAVWSDIWMGYFVPIG